MQKIIDLNHRYHVVIGEQIEGSKTKYFVQKWK